MNNDGDLVIWKFKLSPKVKMPMGARVLTVQLQDGTPELWALCHARAALEERTFLIFGTGQHFPDAPELGYIGTFQMGPFVWHVWEPCSPPASRGGTEER